MAFIIQNLTFVNGSILQYSLNKRAELKITTALIKAPVVYCGRSLEPGAVIISIKPQMVLLTQLMIEQTMATSEEELAKTKSQMALQNALLVHQSARPLPFSINNILHQVSKF